MRRVAIYARVSTDEQTTANQLEELKRWAKNAGHAVVKVYEDAGISGAKGRDQRPALCPAQGAMPSEGAKFASAAWEAAAAQGSFLLQRMSPLLALLRLRAMSDLSPQSVSKRTSPTVAKPSRL